MLRVIQAEQPVIVREVDIAIERERAEVRVIVETVALKPRAERRLREQPRAHRCGEHKSDR